MKDKFVGFLTGFIFAVGLAFAGMTQPQKVVGFLNILGEWDPSLLFVMGMGVLVSAISYKFITWSFPKNRGIESKLIFGSALFGVGWGLAGYCPGPALVSLVTISSASFLFVGSMLLGMLLFYFFERI